MNEQEQQALAVQQRNEITVRLNNRKYTLAVIKDFWDVYDSVLAQRTPEPAPAHHKWATTKHKDEPAPAPEPTYSAQETWPFGQPAPACSCGYDGRNNERDLSFDCPVHWLKSAPAPQSTEDYTVQRMCKAFASAQNGAPGNYQMTAALAEARRGTVAEAEYDRVESDAQNWMNRCEELQDKMRDMYSAAEIEKALREHFKGVAGNTDWPVPEILARLSTKEKT